MSPSLQGSAKAVCCTRSCPHGHHACRFTPMGARLHVQLLQHRSKVPHSWAPIQSAADLPGHPQAILGCTWCGDYDRRCSTLRFPGLPAPPSRSFQSRRSRYDGAVYVAPRRPSPGGALQPEARLRAGQPVPPGVRPDPGSPAPRPPCVPPRDPGKPPACRLGGQSAPQPPPEGEHARRQAARLPGGRRACQPR